MQKKKQKSEADIQKKIMDAHRERGWWVTKLIQTTSNGVPDLLLIKSGRSILIEVKYKGKKPSPLQLYVHSQIEAAGGNVFVTDNEFFLLPD